jgi:hypothetical protein
MKIKTISDLGAEVMKMKIISELGESDEKHSEKLLAEYLSNLNVDQSSEGCCVQ